MVNKLIIDYDAKKIVNLKIELNKTFVMKDLWQAKQILRMRITRDRKNRKLWLCPERYIKKVLERFNISNSKLVCSILIGHYKLSSKQCHTSKKDKEDL